MSDNPHRTRHYRKMVVLLLLERDGDLCGLCGDPLNVKNLSEIEIDHIIMCKDGGQDTPDNLQLAHPFCNSSHNGTPMKDRCIRGHDLTLPGARTGRKKPRCAQCNRDNVAEAYRKKVECV